MLSHYEEIKKRLYRALPAASVTDLDITCLAKEICQLFESKPDDPIELELAWRNRATATKSKDYNKTSLE